MPVRPDNPYTIATKEWYEYNSPGIFDASRYYTSQQTEDQFRSRPASQTSGVRSQDGYTPWLTGGGAVNWIKNGSTQYNNTFNPPGGNPPPGSSTGGGSGGGYGTTARGNDILALINKYKPQQQKWNPLAFKDYKPTAYRQFDSGKYNLMRQGLTDAIGADRSAGNAQYNQLLAELGDYRNPWADPTPQTTNPAMSESMQRMMQANNVPTDINQADTVYGMEADRAFGNLLAVLGTAANQEQGSRVRSTEDYRRNLNERLDAEQRGGTLAVNMSEAQARELYEKEKWEFGESIAQMNYQARTQNQQYNNQGVNAVSAQNVQGNNAWNQSALQALIDMIGSGAKIDPNAFTAFTGA